MSNIKNSMPEGNSEYSLSLSGLFSETPTIQLDHEEIELASEDVAGPEDFTACLADYLQDRLQKAPGPPTPPRESRDIAIPITPETPKPKKRAAKKNQEDTKSGHDEDVKDATATTSPQPQLQPYEMACDDLAKYVVNLQQRNEAMHSENDRLAGKFKSLQVRHLDLIRTSKKHGSDMRKLNERHALITSNLEAQIEEGKEELRDEKGAHNDDNARAEELKEDFDSMYVQYNIMQDKYERLQAAHARLQETHDRLQETRDSLQETHDRLQETRDRLQETHDRLQETHDRLQETHAQEKREAAIEQEKIQRELEETHAQEKREAAIEQEKIQRELDHWVATKITEQESHVKSIDREDTDQIATLSARNRELERIIDVCGRELLTVYGREQFGPAPDGQPQQYRYQTNG